MGGSSHFQVSLAVVSSSIAFKDNLLARHWIDIGSYEHCTSSLRLRNLEKQLLLQADGDDGEEDETSKESGKKARRAAMLRDVNPSSTLEPNFDSLNVKKFDICFTVDPLFQKTSAQFDEGGARGKLSGCSLHPGMALIAIRVRACLNLQSSIHDDVCTIGYAPLDRL